jgi:hypothetical protein
MSLGNKRLGAALVLLAVLGAGGCSKSNSTAGAKGNEGDLSGHIKRGKEILVAENDLSQLGQFYNLYQTEHSRPPTGEELKAYIKQDAPKIYEAIEKGRYVLTPKPGPGSTQVVAYEAEKDLRGIRLVLRTDGSVSRMNDEEFQAALTGK